MENLEDLYYIEDLPNGMAVCDGENSHWQTAHKVVSEELLKEALSKVDVSQADENGFINQAIDMGRTVGKTNCVPITKADRTFMVRRKGRNGETVTVIDAEPSDCRSVVVMLSEKQYYYRLETTYIGDVAPMEPWDPRLLNEGDQEKIKEAKEYWSTHALIYDSDVTEFVMLPDGTKLEKDEFERRFIHGKEEYGFDNPEDAIILMIGVPGSGKSLRARTIAETYEADIIESDAIRDEIFVDELAEENRENVYAKEGKEKVYNEMIKRIEENAKKGKRTIADATFLFESGENARKKIYELAQKYQRPIRAIIVRTSLEFAKMQDKKRDKKVGDEVVERMWNYMDETYDSITAELKSLPNAKFEVIETQNEMTQKRKDDFAKSDDEGR